MRSERSSLLPDGGVTVNSATGPGDLTLGDADPSTASLDNVYLDGTLVLVGCGAAKRDPDDPVDVHEAVVEPGEEFSGEGYGKTGPAWRAEDLYTSTYFGAKREFAETVTAWTGSTDSPGWSILSAEHGIMAPTQLVTPYDTTVDDHGDDPTNEDHWAESPYRRPDGAEVVTEMDKWATQVAFGLAKWLAGHRERKADPWESEANTLLVLAGKKYVEPLRERNVFENGIARVSGDPNQGYGLPVETRFLFEEIDAGGIGEQMAWLSNAVDRLGAERQGESQQAEMGAWTGSGRACNQCGVSAEETDTLTEYGGEVCCEACAPDRCNRCDSWTHENGLGNYPLCSDCQTQYGGRKDDPVAVETHEQATFTDGGE